MKFIASGVTLSAAITKSPSFSRSGSSTTITILPLRMSSIAFSIVAKVSVTIKIVVILWRMPADEPILTFESPREWERWLAKNHKQPGAVWLQMFKKASGKQALTYDDALEVALCYGWIDGLMRSHDDESFVQRFTPRRAKSVWSKRNRERIERLTQNGR